MSFHTLGESTPAPRSSNASRQTASISQLPHTSVTDSMGGADRTASYPRRPANGVCWRHQAHCDFGAKQAKVAQAKQLVTALMWLDVVGDRCWHDVAALQAKGAQWLDPEPELMTTPALPFAPGVPLMDTAFVRHYRFEPETSSETSGTILVRGVKPVISRQPGGTTRK